MTLTTPSSRNTYTGNGTSTVFAYGFKIFNASDLQVTLTSPVGAVTTLTLGTDYTVSGVGAATGGNVTFTVPPTNLYTIKIQRVPALTQPTSIRNQGSFQAQVHEDQFDRFTMVDQYLQQQITDNAAVVLAGPVQSFAGRAGVVVPQSGDYSASQITGLAAFIVANGVSGFNGRQGAVMPQAGDYIASQVGFTQSGAGAILSNLDARIKQGAVSVMDFVGCDPTGTTDSSTAFANAVATGKNVYVPAGTYKAASISLAAGQIMYGDGPNSVVTVAGNNSNIILFNNANSGIYRLRLVGDGTTSGTTNGYGCYGSGGGFLAVDCVWSGFGAGAMGGNDSVGVEAPKVIRPIISGSGTGATEFYLGGLWKDFLLVDAYCTTTQASRALLIFDNSTTGWTNCRVLGGHFEGYQLQALAGTDEHAVLDNENRVFAFTVDGAYFKNINWSAVKTKFCRGVRIVNCFMDSCSLTAEDSVNGLYGAILTNAIGNVDVSHNTIRNSGTDAIRVTVQNTTTTPDRIGRNLWSVNANIIDGTGTTTGSPCGNGISIGGYMSSVQVHDNNMRNVARSGIQVLGTATQPGWDISLKNNLLEDSSSATLYPITVQYYDTLSMDGNGVSNWGTTPTNFITNVLQVRIGPTDYHIDPATTGFAGYTFTNTQILSFAGRSGNTTRPQWAALTAYTVGQRVYNGTNTYECTVAGTSASSGGPVVTSGTTVDGTVTWQFVGKYGLMSYGLRFTGTNPQVVISDSADFSGVATGVFQAAPTGYAGKRVDVQTVASASTITAPSTLFKMSGTNPVSTINPPFTGFLGRITVLPTGAWTLATGGNIQFAAKAVVGEAMDLDYDGTTWHEVGRGTLTSVAGAPSAPAATTSTTLVMMGLGGAFTFTPTRTGRMQLAISGQLANNTVSDGATVQLKYGTGTAPNNGDAVTGTSLGGQVSFTARVAQQQTGFIIRGTVNLTVGTTYWLDAALLAITGGSASISSLTLTADEL